MSHFSEAEWTLCTYLFYTAHTDVALKYIRDRSLAVVVTVGVLAADARRNDLYWGHCTSFWQWTEHRVQHTRVSVSLWQRQNVGFKNLAFLGVLLKIVGFPLHPRRRRKLRRASAEEWPCGGGLMPSNPESYAAFPDSANKFVLSLDLKTSRMTASLTSGGSWCQKEGRLREEKISAFERIFIFAVRSRRLVSYALDYLLEKRVAPWPTKRIIVSISEIQNWKLGVMENESSALQLHCLHLLFCLTELNRGQSGGFVT